MKLTNINRLTPYSCVLGLGVLGLVMINPSVCNLGDNSGLVHAAEISPSTGTAISLVIDGWTSSDGSNDSASGSVLATDVKTAYISHDVTVNISNATSYTLQITAAEGKSGSLIHENGTASIAGANGAKGNEMADNTWGYSWDSMSADITSLPYYTLPAYGSTTSNISDGLLESANADTNGDVSFTKRLTFAAKFGSDVPDGSYGTEALISLAVDPETLTWDTIEYMQDMTPEICSSAPLNVQKTLTDRRGDNTYTIARIKNQTNDTALCWMTQNLRIIDKTLKSEDSDVEDEFTVPASNISGFNSSDQYQPKAYYDNNTNYGAYYNWYTATAGTGNADVKNDGENVDNSICPRGWRLPTGNDGGEFYQLLNGVTGVNIIKTPYNFTASGNIENGTLNSDFGYYWSSTADSNNKAYSLGFFDRVVVLSSSYNRYFGRSVRCVAR